MRRVYSNLYNTCQHHGNLEGHHLQLPVEGLPRAQAPGAPLLALELLVGRWAGLTRWSEA